MSEKVTEKSTKISIRTAYKIWHGPTVFALNTTIFVLAIGTTHWWFGGSWVVDFMLAAMWIWMLVMLGKLLPSPIIMDTSLTPEQVRKAIQEAGSNG